MPRVYVCIGSADTPLCAAVWQGPLTAPGKACSLCCCCLPTPSPFHSLSLSRSHSRPSFSLSPARLLRLLLLGCARVYTFILAREHTAKTHKRRPGVFYRVSVSRVYTHAAETLAAATRSVFLPPSIFTLFSFHCTRAHTL